MERTSSTTRWLLCVMGLVIVVATSVDAQLSTNFYASKCPKGPALVDATVKTWIRRDRTLAASLLRLHFHDCFVRGCDGSVLLDGSTSEKQSGSNKNSLRGFNVIDDVKSKLEALCPGVWSCADIVALVARDAIKEFSGGPTWNVQLGRRDGVRSSQAEATKNLPAPTLNFRQLVQIFAQKGLSAHDMVVLSGAHTIGRAHCSHVGPRLYNFSPRFATDPSLNPAFARQLKKQCKKGDTKTLIRMDQSTSSDTFDNHYFSNVLSGRGLFTSDDTLRENSAGLKIVRAQSKLASDSAFGAAMVKMGRIGVLTGKSGQIRKKCNVVNS